MYVYIYVSDDGRVKFFFWFEFSNVVPRKTPDAGGSDDGACVRATTTTTTGWCDFYREARVASGAVETRAVRRGDDVVITRTSRARARF